jgi:eukaryotic-like serine/threonine-protein kinase
MQPQLIAGRYRVLRAIGRGGMGTVWLCRDEVLGREVAVKQIGALPGESATETKRAMREARSAAALNHPNAVAVYDVVDHGGRPWLVMEYVEGQTLADEISRDGQLSPQRVADIGAQLAGALARAHERGIVHRDIKPGNVLIDKAGRPKISDFGIARGHGDEKLTQIGFITGTPGYLSPELARGCDPLPASDVWALGATLYEAVEGQSPYEPRSNPIALLRAIATERPRPMTQAGALGPAIDAMMHEDPARRWDMATSAKRLGGIARITMVMPRVDVAGTAVVVAPPHEPTQSVEPTRALGATQALAATQRLKAAAPVVAAPEVAATVVAATVVAPPEVAATVSAAPVVAASEAVAPVVAASEAVAPAVETPVVAAPAADAPVVEAVAPARPGPQGPPDVHGGVPVVPSHDRRIGRRWVPLALVALLVSALGMVYLLSLFGDPGRPRIAATTSATRQAKPTATGTSKVSEPSRATSSAPGSVTAAPAQNADQKLEDFVTSYYSDVTKDTGRTWGELAPIMQNAAGGRAGYDGFWKTIDRVRVNQTRADVSGKRAVVSLTFTRSDGRTSTENHQFTFVTDGGGYLIASDKFLG